MTSRERWTVYPLLFLSIGMGLKTRLTGMENVPAISCQNLTINDAAGKPVARLHATAGSQGQFEIFNAEGKPLLVAGGSKKGNAGQLLIANDKGATQVSLGSNGSLGIIETCGPDGQPSLTARSGKRGGMVQAWRGDRKLVLSLGHDDADSGVFAIDTVTGQRATAPFATLIRKPVTEPEAPQLESPPKTEE